MKKTNVFLIFLLLMLSSMNYAQDFDDVSLDDLEEDHNATTKMVYREKTTGLLKEEHVLNKDRNRLSLVYHFNKDFSSIAGVQNIEGIFAKKFSSYWIEFFAFQLNATHSEIFSSGSSLDQGESEDSILAFGAAISYRGDWIQDFLGSNNLYSMTSAGLGYYSYTNNFTEDTYKGLGLKCDFGMHYRTSATFHYGMKMTYHLAPMTRAATFDGEPSSARSVTASWVSLGLDLSLYF
jgi:hypothetical protein